MGCPLRVISRHFATTLRMSAIGGKADINHRTAKSPLIAISGHSPHASFLSAYTPKADPNRPITSYNSTKITPRRVFFQKCDGCHFPTIPYGLKWRSRVAGGRAHCNPVTGCPVSPRKGKPSETVGRKTTGLRRKPRRRSYRKEKRKCS